MVDPILDIKTLTERPTIAIDGESYEILSPEEVSVVDHHWFSAQGRRMAALLSKDKLSDKETRELGRIVVDLSDRVMVGVPDAVRDKLTEVHRASIVQVFIELPSGPSATGAPRKRKASSTGARSSRVSKGSTAATRPAGSPRRPSSSSGRT